MSGINSLRGVEHFEDLLKEKADTLVGLLAQGNISQAMDQINELYEFRHQLFYQEVGSLTRGLHEAIKSFGTDVQDSLQGGAKNTEFHDASQSLDYVVDLTEKNAHETMDRLDRALGLIESLESQGIGEHAGDDLAKLRTELTDILVAQGYQDIAGQLIRKVTALVTNVEQRLVHLMNMASTVERLAGEPAQVDKAAPTKPASTKTTVVAEGPQINGKNNPEVVCEQDDVDELLSSLGF